MDKTGLAIGVIGLTGQLAKAATDCYKIFDAMNDVGSTYDAILHELRTQGLLLKGWERAWGIGSDSNNQRLDPGDYRYRYATASLARIVAVFSSVDELQAKYGIVATTAGGGGAKRTPRLRDRLSVMPVRVRSKSPGLSTKKEKLPILRITKDDLHLLENPQVLEDKQLLPELGDEIKSMTQAMERVQQSLPTYLKLRWVISDKARIEELLKKLTSLNNGLFQVLPTLERSLALPANPPLQLSFDIPFFLDFRKNPDFVGREYLLENLRREIEKGKDILNIIVLYGTGGMGKTQLALEYVHQHQQDYSSVFWVNAASVQTTILGFTQIMQRLIQHHLLISEDISNIGRLLGMAGKLDSTGCFMVSSESDGQHVVNAVKQWFSATKNTNWLLVFDNLDDLDLVNIEEYLPSCNHGTVIITSKRPESIEEGRRGFEVQQMHPMEAVQLLLRACAISRFEDLVPMEQTAASAVAQELGYLPLALNQAGAYVHISQYSFSRYLEEYPNKASYLLSRRWKGGQYGRSVFATWEISFKAIQEKNPKAAELLLVCGFLDHQDIREELLWRGLKLEKHDLCLQESIRTLFSYSLAKRGTIDETFSIHPLVHSWARLRLGSEPHKETEVAMKAFEIITTGVCTSDKSMTTEDWIFEQQIMPHIAAMAKNITGPFKVGDMQILDGAHILGVVFRRHGLFGEAMEWFGQALAERETALGVDHPDTLSTVHNMAIIHRNQGRYDQALEWYGRALAGRETALGADHPDTLSTVHNIAITYRNQERYDQALEWFGRVLAERETALGADHPATLSTVHNIAITYHNQGRYDQALEWYGRVLARRETALGVGHPDTLRTVNNMATIYRNQGRYDQALEWYQRSLAGMEKTLGLDHPDTLDTVNNMAIVYMNQGQ